MWSVVERTALAEAEVEYQDYESDTIWVKFPVGRLAGEVPTSSHATSSRLSGRSLLRERSQLADAHVVIWTTTPWTIPGNRAVNYSPRVKLRPL